MIRRLAAAAAALSLAACAHGAGPASARFDHTRPEPLPASSGALTMEQANCAAAHQALRIASVDAQHGQMTVYCEAH